LPESINTRIARKGLLIHRPRINLFLSFPALSHGTLMFGSTRLGYAGGKMTTLNRRSFNRKPWAREMAYQAQAESDAAISKEIARAVEVLSQRMPMNDAMALACKVADEAGAGYRGWEKLKPSKEALANLVGPAPMTCPNCGAEIICPMCGRDGREK